MFAYIYELFVITNIATVIHFINLYNVNNDILLYGAISLIINHILLKIIWQ